MVGQQLPPGPYAAERRRLWRDSDATYIVYNFPCSGRSDSDPIPPQPKYAGTQLFSLTRTGIFSTEYPFLGHAPSSDSSFTGLLEPLNVDRAREDRWVRKTRCGTVETRTPAVEDEAGEVRGQPVGASAGRTVSDDGDGRGTGNEIEAENVEVKEVMRDLPYLNNEEVEHFRAAIALAAEVTRKEEEGRRKDREDTEARLRRFRESREWCPPPQPPPLPSMRAERKARQEGEAEETEALTQHEPVGVSFANRLSSAAGGDVHTGGEMPDVRQHGGENMNNTSDSIAYVLRKDVVKIAEWSDLEETLFDFVEAMKREKTFGGNPWFLDSHAFRRPSSYGYRLPNPSEEDMQKARAAFIAVIALARMYVESYRWFLRCRHRLQTGKWVSATHFDAMWTREIHKRQPHVPVAWMDDLLRTAVGMDKPGRAGIFVDIHDVYVLGVVMYQINLGMPVFIACPLESQAWIAKLDYIDKYQVLRMLIRESEDPFFYKRLRAKLDNDTSETTMTDMRSAVDFSFVDGVGDITDTSPHGFDVNLDAGHTEILGRDPLVRHSAPSPEMLLERHSKDLEVIKSAETLTERQSREARERNAEETSKRPGRSSKAAHCFEWEEETGGGFVRRYVPRPEVSEAWGRYNRYSRKYLSAWNEWDLWEGYDRAEDGSYPAHNADDDLQTDSDSESTEVGDKEQRPFALEITKIEWNLADPAVYERQLLALERRVVQTRSRHEIGTKLARSTLVERASKYFGYQRTRKLAEGKRPSNEEVRCAVLKLFEIPEWQTSVLPSDLEAVCRLVQQIEEADGEWKRLNHLLCDFHEQAPAYLLNNKGCPVTVRLHDLPRASAGVQRGQRPKKQYIVSDTLYVLTPKTGQFASFEAGVTESLAAARALRFEGTFIDLLYDFLRSGVKVHFLRAMRGTTASSRTETIPRPLPLFRTDKISPHDYKQYQSRLILALESDPLLAFKAFKEGGIVWRLVVQHVVVQDLLRDVPETASTPAMSGAAVSRMKEVFDEELTEDEERIICGVYDTSSDLEGADNALWSWWPRPLVWYKSSVYCGQWTMYNERWFLARQANLERGNVDGELKLQTQWRTMLDGQRRRGDRFFKASSKLASNWLHTHFT